MLAASRPKMRLAVIARRRADSRLVDRGDSSHVVGYKAERARKNLAKDVVDRSTGETSDSGDYVEGYLAVVEPGALRPEWRV